MALACASLWMSQKMTLGECWPLDTVVRNVMCFAWVHEVNCAAQLQWL